MQANASVNVEAEANTTTNAVYGHDPSWQTVIDWPDYQINVQYPYEIRNRDSGRVVKRSLNGQGYWQVHLDGKSYLLHRLIAKQFVHNDDPEHKTCVDHINRDKTDYHIENLRWTTQSDNLRNKTSHKGVVYRYVDEIADDCIVINSYGNKTLQNYFYDENLDQFYWHDVELDRYREIPTLTMKNGTRYASALDSEGKYVRIYINKFKSLYNLD